MSPHQEQEVGALLVDGHHLAIEDRVAHPNLVAGELIEARTQLSPGAPLSRAKRARTPTPQLMQRCFPS